VVTICTTSLTFNNSTFSPHSVFMCFVWISEQTAIISLYNINWSVFITERESVYCAVRTGYLNIIQVDLSLQNYNADFSRTLKALVSQLSQLNPHANTEHFLSSGRPLLQADT